MDEFFKWRGPKKSKRHKPGSAPPPWRAALKWQRLEPYEKLARMDRLRLGGIGAYYYCYYCCWCVADLDSSKRAPAWAT